MPLVVHISRRVWIKGLNDGFAVSLFRPIVSIDSWDLLSGLRLNLALVQHRCVLEGIVPTLLVTLSRIALVQHRRVLEGIVPTLLMTLSRIALVLRNLWLHAPLVLVRRLRDADVLWRRLSLVLACIVWSGVWVWSRRERIRVVLVRNNHSTTLLVRGASAVVGTVIIIITAFFLHRRRRSVAGQ